MSSLIVALLATLPSQVCRELPGQEVECLTDAEFRRQIESGPDLGIDVDDVMATIQRARESAGTSVLLVDRQYRFRGARLGRQLQYRRFHLARRFDVVERPIDPMLALQKLDRRPLYSSVDIYDDEGDDSAGGNTDGQMLHGPPGDAATWGCTGYSTNDTCKACCMMSRSALLAPIYAWAKICHAGAGLDPWLQAGCLISEAVYLAALWYSADKCNDNCESRYYNDRSVDWGGLDSNHPLRQRLTSGDYTECEGWVSHYRWSGYDWLLLSSDWDQKLGTVECIMYLYRDVNEIAEELYWGAQNRYVRVVGTDGYDFDAVDYRILDVDHRRKGRQIPYVGHTSIDGDETFMVLERTGQRLYLDGRFPRVNESLKLWVYGKRKGNRLNVSEGGILWWSFVMEGAFDED